jgi:hypothetical protein
MGEAEPDDDEEARRRRAASLRSAIERRGGAPRPATPREFTDRAAREAAEAAHEDDGEPEDERDA